MINYGDYRKVTPEQLIGHCRQNGSEPEGYLESLRIQLNNLETRKIKIFETINDWNNRPIVPSDMLQVKVNPWGINRYKDAAKSRNGGELRDYISYCKEIEVIDECILVIKAEIKETEKHIPCPGSKPVTAKRQDLFMFDSPDKFIKHMDDLFEVGYIDEYSRDHALEIYKAGFVNDQKNVDESLKICWTSSLRIYRIYYENIAKVLFAAPRGMWNFFKKHLTFNGKILSKETLRKYWQKEPEVSSREKYEFDSFRSKYNQYLRDPV